MRRGKLTIVCALTFGCGPRATVQAEPSADVGWIVAVLETLDQGILAASPLQRLNAEGVVEVGLADVPAPRLVLLGYRDEDILALGRPPDSTEAMRAASSSDPWLPDPVWLATGGRSSRGFDVQAAPIDPNAPRHLTASWLPACPSQPPARRLADLSCAVAQCEPRFVQDGCVLHVDAQGCGGPEVSLAVGAHGELSIDDGNPCRTLEPAPDAAISLSCAAGCELSLYDAPPLESIELSSIPVPNGFAYGLASAGTGVVVVKNGLPLDGGCETVESELYFINPVTVTFGESKRAPPCVSHLSSNPGGTGFFMVYGRTASVAWFDAAGTSQRVRPLDPRARRATGVVARDRDLVISALGPAGEDGVVELRDAETLELRRVLGVPRVSGAPPSTPVAVTLLGGRRAAVLDAAGASLYIVDLVSAEFQATARLGPVGARSATVGAALWVDPDGPEILVGFDGAVRRFDARTLGPLGPPRRPYVGALGTPTAIAPWEAPAGHIIAFSGARASLGLTQDGHLRREVRTAGAGMILGGVVDVAGNVWFALPDDHQIVRASRR